MEPLETLRAVVVLIHLVGFAVLFGGWVVQAFGDRRVSRLMDFGLLIALLAGLVLAAPWPAGMELNYVKLGVKLVIVVVIGALIGVGSARQRRNEPVPSAVFWLIGILTLVNAALALIWQ